ncbi:MAG: Rnf-Nqr domain containing protein [Planctomycetota bacterium]|jgi:Na+-transporting NADH:ubiquinone oxidoreductase subunit E
MTTMINYAIYHFVLVPVGLEHLQFIVFIAVIAAFVQFVEMFVERFSPKLYFALGISASAPASAGLWRFF